jgi:Leucine-rich repeat (LRR) protein
MPRQSTNMKLFLVLLLMKLATGLQCPFDECECYPNDLGYEVNCATDVLKQEMPKRNLNSHVKKISLFEGNNQEFQRIPDSRFAGLSISMIELQNSRISEIGVLAFHNLTDIDMIDLSMNEIERLHPSVFAHVAGSLKQLLLSKNLLGHADVKELSEALNNAKSLIGLGLNSNQLRFLPDLRQNVKLQELELRRNNISTLASAEDGESLLPESLTMIDLEYNQLQTIELNWFANLKNLKFLNLKYNRIHSIAENAFANLVHLEKLTLARNELKQLPNTLISTMKKLSVFDMSEQNAFFSRIESYSFDHDSNAANDHFMIDLSKNRIEFLDKRAFCTRQNKRIQLTQINLDFNPLQPIDPCVFVNLKRDANLTRVLLNAELDCDCRIQFIASLVKLEGKCVTDKGTFVSMADYKCENEAEFEATCSDEYTCDFSSSTPATVSSSTILPTPSGEQKAAEIKSPILSTLAPAKPAKSGAESSLGLINYLASATCLTLYTVFKRIVF